MDRLKQLFDYQRFALNPLLQKQIEGVYRRYLSRGEVLSDDELDVAAAGELRTYQDRKPHEAGGTM